MIVLGGDVISGEQYLERDDCAFANTRRFTGKQRKNRGKTLRVSGYSLRIPEAIKLILSV